MNWWTQIIEWIVQYSMMPAECILEILWLIFKNSMYTKGIFWLVYCQGSEWINGLERSWVSCKFEDIIARVVPFSTSVLDWVYCSTLFCFFWQNSNPSFASLSLVVQLLSYVQLFVTPWPAARQPSLTFTISWSLLKFMSTASVMPSNHLILCQLKTKFLPPNEIDTKALWVAPVGNRRCVTLGPVPFICQHWMELEFSSLN